MTAGNFSKTDYEPAKIDMLHDIVKKAALTERPQEYEIMLDKFVAVPRNNDPSRFLSFQNFLTYDTKVVEVRFFRPSMTQPGEEIRDRYQYLMEGVEKKGTLNGVPSGKSEKDIVEKIDAIWEIKTLKEKNASLEQDIVDLDAEMDNLEAENDKLKEVIEKLKEKGNFSAEQITELMGTVGTVVQIFKGGPLPPAAQQISGTPESGASFERKEEAEGEQITVTDKEAALFELLCELRAKLRQEDLVTLTVILDKLGNNAHALISTRKHIENFLNQKPKKEDEKI